MNTVKDEIMNEAVGDDPINFEIFFDDKIALFTWAVIKESVSKIESNFNISLVRNDLRMRRGQSSFSPDI